MTNQFDGSENAFPTDQYSMKHRKGMSLREYFAGQALIGILAGPGSSNMSEWNIASEAFLIADAMMTERDKRALAKCNHQKAARSYQKVCERPSNTEGLQTEPCDAEEDGEAA